MRVVQIASRPSPLHLHNHRCRRHRHRLTVQSTASEKNTSLHARNSPPQLSFTSLSSFYWWAFIFGLNSPDTWYTDNIVNFYTLDIQIRLMFDLSLTILEPLKPSLSMNPHHAVSKECLAHLQVPVHWCDTWRVKVAQVATSTNRLKYNKYNSHGSMW